MRRACRRLTLGSSILTEHSWARRITTSEVNTVKFKPSSGPITTLSVARSWVMIGLGIVIMSSVWAGGRRQLATSNWLRARPRHEKRRRSDLDDPRGGRLERREVANQDPPFTVRFSQKLRRPFRAPGRGMQPRIGDARDGVELSGEG